MRIKTTDKGYEEKTVKALLKKLIGRSPQGNALEFAQQLLEAGLVRESIEHLTTENRRNPSASIETRLMEIRHNSFSTLPHPLGRTHWPPKIVASPFAPGVIPSVEKSRLSASTLTQGILGHGALIVRELLSTAQIDILVKSIDSAIAAYDAGLHDGRSDEQKAWYTPLQPGVGGERLHIARKWVRDGGGLMAADSPRGFFNLLDALEQSGVMPVLTDYLGERPALSLKKTTLRRVSPQLADSGWHQDGAFLGQGIRTVNLWIALTDCGADAPSMDMVPKRMPEIIPTGEGAAHFSWSVDEATVREAAGDAPPVRLQFRAGDAILFDERNLHRTAVGPGMTQERHAIEAWFFAPSCYPLDKIPLLC